MENKILIATTNKGKVLEFNFFLHKLLLNFSFISLSDVPTVLPPKEIGNTFLENATIKAEFYFNTFKMPVIVEDSGFCVEKLNDLPGVHSAEWGEGGDFTNGIKRLYKMLDGNLSPAFFQSVIIFKTKEKEIIGNGKIEGVISQTAKGINGFGFDPCFIPNGFTKTFGEMNLEEKSLISHRKIAILDLITKL